MMIFKHIDDATCNKVIVKSATDTWMVATEQFISFLQACGYVVRGIDVADYLQENYRFQRDDCADGIVPLKKKKRRVNANERI